MSSVDFGAARQRILARRAAASSSAGSVSPIPSPPPYLISILGRLPPPLLSLLLSSLPLVSSLGRTLGSPFGTRPAFRVGQLDAELLDEELLTLLKQQVGDALRLRGPSLEDDWSSEINAALRGALWWLSIWAKGVSYGGSLQGLIFVDSRGEGGLLSRLLGVGGRRAARAAGDEPVGGRVAPSKAQKLMYGLVTVGARYGWDKWEDWLLDREGGHDTSPTVERLSRVTRALSATHEVAALAGFLVFLHNGRYRTLVDRVLGLRLVPATAQTSREVSFEYLNRQLVWHAFTEFLLFILPLVGINRWRRWLGRAWRKVKAVFARRAGVAGQDDEDEAMAQGELGFLPERTCAICYKDGNPAAAAGGSSEAELLASSANGGIIGSAQTDITNPYEAIPCGCVYCFVCLAQRLEAEDGEGWTCLRCGELVRECKPWSGDVIEETSASPPSPGGSRGAGKSVVFADAAASGDGQDGGDGESDDELERSGLLSPVEPMPVDDEDDDGETTDAETFDEGTGELTDASWVEYGDGQGEDDAASVVSDATA